MYRSYLSINAALVERNHSVIRVLPIGSTTKKLGISLWLCLMQWYHNKKNLVVGGVVQASYHIPTTFSLLCIGTSGATRGGGETRFPPSLDSSMIMIVDHLLSNFVKEEKNTKTFVWRFVQNFWSKKYNKDYMTLLELLQTIRGKQGKPLT